MGEDFYRFGKPLTPRGLFQLVTDEAFRDGSVDAKENKLLVALAGYLKIEPAAAKDIARRSREKYRANMLGLERGFEKTKLYKRILRFVISDGKIDETEYHMIEVLRVLFKISLDEHDEMLSVAQMELGETESFKVTRSYSESNPYVLATDKDLPRIDLEVDDDEG